MAGLIYGLCAITALWCGGLMLRAFKKRRYRLLLWSGICFLFLAVNNLLLVVDRVILPMEIDLLPLRLSAALVGMLLLLYGLIWDTD